MIGITLKAAIGNWCLRGLGVLLWSGLGLTLEHPEVGCSRNKSGLVLPNLTVAICLLAVCHVGRPDFDSNALASKVLCTGCRNSSKLKKG